MRISVDKGIFANYPRTQIGFVVATLNQNPGSKPIVDQIVSQLKEGMIGKGFKEGVPVQKDPRIDVWRKTFSSFGVKGSEVPSSVESLCKRAFGDKFPRILPVIDLYNAHSVRSLLPMGGYDINTLRGDITLQHAKVAGEFLGIGSKEPVAVDPKHVVYKDGDEVICWLWNHKDALRTSITANTQHAIFFFDCVDSSLPGATPMQAAIADFWDSLSRIGAKPHMNGILSPSNPSMEVNLSLFEITPSSSSTSFDEEPPLSASNEIHSPFFNGAINPTITLLRNHPLSLFQLDGNRQSVLMHAAVNGSDVILDYVLFQLDRLVAAKRITPQKKLDYLNSASSFQETALHTASRHHRIEMVQKLLAAGCDSTLVNASGETPKDVALQKGYFGVTTQLV